MNSDTEEYQDVIDRLQEILDLMAADPSGTTLGVPKWKVEMTRERLGKALKDVKSNDRSIAEQCWAIASHLRAAFKLFSEYGEVDETGLLVQKMLQLHDISARLSGR